MKKVLLLGDSIRMGYDDYVKDLLGGECEVYYDPEDNGRFSAYTLWQMNQFFKHFGHFDVVHWNNGYWDMNIEAPMTTAMHPVDEYVHYLRRILGEIRRNGAVPVFATTTPILSAGQAADISGTGADSINYNNDWVVAYNEAALAVMQEEVPASILIAEAILEDGRSTSELATSASYAVYGEYLEEVAEQYVEWLGRTDDSYDEVLESLESAGVLETDYADSLRDLIETYELDRYDKPLRNSLDGTLVDAATGEDLGLSYTDYANLERIATSYIGTPYVWGGSTEDTGFDCSGLVQWSYSKALGLLIPRTTYYQQYVGVSVPLDVDKLRMGDLLFFHDNSEGTYHVAMYLADGYYLHAPHSGDVVRIASMEDFAPTFARRLVEFAPAG